MASLNLQDIISCQNLHQKRGGTNLDQSKKKMAPKFLRTSDQQKTVLYN